MALIIAGILEIRGVGEKGIVTIKGVAAKKFICVSKKGAVKPRVSVFLIFFLKQGF